MAEPFQLKVGMKFKSTKNNKWSYMICEVQGDWLRYQLLQESGEPFGMQYPIRASEIQEDLNAGVVMLAEDPDGGSR